MRKTVPTAYIALPVFFARRRILALLVFIKAPTAPALAKSSAEIAIVILSPFILSLLNIGYRDYEPRGELLFLC